MRNVLENGKLLTGLQQFAYDYSGDLRHTAPKFYLDGWQPVASGYTTVEGTDGTVYCCDATGVIFLSIPAHGVRSIVPSVADVAALMAKGKTQDEAVVALGGNP